MKQEYVLALEFGGRSVRAARVNTNGDLEGYSSFQLSQNPMPLSNFLHNLGTIIAQARGSYPITAVGVGAPSPCDEKTLTFDLRQKPSYQQVNGYPLIGHIFESAGCQRMFVDNDASAAARGECWKGKIPPAGKYIFATLGTGLGGCFILYRMIVRGRTIGATNSGEIWDMQHDGMNLEDYCGTTKAMVSIYSSLIRQGEAADIDVLSGDIKKLAGMARDAGGIWWNTTVSSFIEFGNRLGKGFIQPVWDFGAMSVILSGAISNAFDLFRNAANDSLEEELFNREWWNKYESIPLFVKSDLIEKGGLLGAAKLAFNNMRIKTIEKKLAGPGGLSLSP